MSYKLLDSGNGEKLEQLGSYTVVRPCKTAVWSRRYPSLWKKPSARFIPGQGWSSADGEESWVAEIGGISLQLRLQNNGQIGVFPEHSSYLGPCLESLDNASHVLNLFAYTGYASVACAARGAHVTHVDLSKSCLSWVKQNFLENQLSLDLLRLISDDAVKFVAKEVERGSRYDLIIADPPNFSRISKNKQWDIEDILPDLVKMLGKLLSSQGTLIVTSHRPEYCDSVLHNLILDSVDESFNVEHSPLRLLHHDDSRVLPAGFLAKASPH